MEEGKVERVEEVMMSRHKSTYGPVPTSCLPTFGIVTRRKAVADFYGKCRSEASEGLRCACGKVALYRVIVYRSSPVRFLGYCKEHRPSGDEAWRAVK